MKRYKPMLATLEDEKYLKKDEFIYEPKLDGYRALCYKSGNDIWFFSRNGNDFTLKFPELDIVDNIMAETAVIDGEIVIYNEDGFPDFNLLQKREENPLDVSHLATFVVFDVLVVDDMELIKKPLENRKRILDEVVLNGDRIQKIFYTDEGEFLFKEMKKRNMEGVIGKNFNGSYIQKRSRDWVKVKITKTIDCIIIGYTTTGKRDISSLALAVYDEEGKLTYIGKVGTGFNESTIKDIKSKLEETSIKYVNTKEKDIIWVKPDYTCEVTYLQMTKNKVLRAPSFMRLRPDKSPQECTLENQ